MVRNGSTGSPTSGELVKEKQRASPGRRGHSLRAPPHVGPQPVGSPMRALAPTPAQSASSSKQLATTKHVGFARTTPEKRAMRPRRISVSGKPIPPPPKRPLPPGVAVPGSLSESSAPASTANSSGNAPTTGHSSGPRIRTDGLRGDRSVDPNGGVSPARSGIGSSAMGSFADTPMHTPGMGKLARASFSVSFSPAALKQHLQAASVSSLPAS